MVLSSTVRVLSGFAFVEYRDPRDAEDAISELNGRDFMGDRLSIDFARAPRERRPFRDDYGPPPPRGRGGPPPKGIRCKTNIAARIAFFANSDRESNTPS